MADVLEVLEDGTEILRDFTPEELAARKAAQAEADQIAQEAADKAAAREAVLRKLGLDDDDLTALGL